MRAYDPESDGSGFFYVRNDGISWKISFFQFIARGCSAGIISAFESENMRKEKGEMENEYRNKNSSSFRTQTGREGSRKDRNARGGGDHTDAF